MSIPELFLLAILVKVVQVSRRRLVEHHDRWIHWTVLPPVVTD